MNFIKLILFISLNLLALPLKTEAQAQGLNELLDRIILLNDKVNRTASFLSPGYQTLPRESLCALTERGKIFCAGNNEFGQMGKFGFEFALPQNLVQPDFPLGTYFVDIGPEYGNLHGVSTDELAHTYCALDQNGNLFCWGRQFNQRADNPYRPVFMNPQGVKFESMFLTHGFPLCAIDTQGLGYCYEWILERSRFKEDVVIGNRTPILFDAGSPMLAIVTPTLNDRITNEYCAILRENRLIKCSFSKAENKKKREQFYSEHLRLILARQESRTKPAHIPAGDSLPSEIEREDRRLSKLRADLQRVYDKVQNEFPEKQAQLLRCLSDFSNSTKYEYQILEGTSQVVPILHSAYFKGYGWDSPEAIDNLEPQVDVRFRGYAVAGRVDQWGQAVFEVIQTLNDASGHCQYFKSSNNLPQIWGAEKLFGKTLKDPVDLIQTDLNVMFPRFTQSHVNNVFDGNVIYGFSVGEAVTKFSIQFKVKEARSGAEVLSQLINLNVRSFTKLSQ